MKLLLALLAVLFSGILAAEKRRLNDFITHYEPVEYDSSELMYHHERLRRSIGGKRHLELQFSALGKHFNFRLYPDRSVFSNDFQMHVSGRPTRSVDMTMYYSGQAVGDPSTKITGDVSHGTFTGMITSRDEHYHIEPASYHFPADHPHHSIIYRSADVDQSALKGETCGLSHDDTMESMLKTQGAPRQKRNAPLSQADRNQLEATVNRTLTVCKLSMIGDFRFFQEVGNGNINVAKAFLARMVMGANAIYESTNFYGTSNADLIRFIIARVDVFEDADPLNFQSDFIGVESYLERHSAEGHSDVCLAYRFTYRDFANGVLGLAYVAQRGATGGICASNLNTGIVTLLNFGRRVPENVNVLTFAHEIGHNFGSFHDPVTAECQPASGGNYIMFPSASTGSEPNNDEFSSCSVDCMEAIITSRAQQISGGCFIEDPLDCGDGILGDGEDCDCMFDFDMGTGICFNDTCCNGRDCTLAGGMACSPQQGPCCTTGCMFQPAGLLCSSETECADESLCDGSAAACPTPGAKIGANSTALPCNNGTATCSNGTCSGSLCSLLGFEECLCTGEQACNLCCLVNMTCTPTTDLDADTTMSIGGNTMLPVGEVCNSGDVIGFCDFLSQCRPIDADGALNRLLNFLSSDEIQSVILWIIDMWWVLVVAIVVILIILFVIVVICHFTLPKPKHMKQQEEYRRTLRRNKAQAERDYPLTNKM